MTALSDSRATFPVVHCTTRKTRSELRGMRPPLSDPAARTYGRARPPVCNFGVTVALAPGTTGDERHFAHDDGPAAGSPAVVRGAELRPPFNAAGRWLAAQPRCLGRLGGRPHPGLHFRFDMEGEGHAPE